MERRGFKRTTLMWWWKQMPAVGAGVVCIVRCSVIKLLGVGNDFCAGGDFSEEESTLHINQKESLALLRVIQLYIERVGGENLAGVCLSAKVDNLVLNKVHGKCGGKNRVMVVHLRTPF